jgi:hypothetical protein
VCVLQAIIVGTCPTIDSHSYGCILNRFGGSEMVALHMKNNLMKINRVKLSENGMLLALLRH